MLLAGISKVVVELVALANSMVTPAVSQVHLSKTFPVGAGFAVIVIVSPAFAGDLSFVPSTITISYFAIDK